MGISTAAWRARIGLFNGGQTLQNDPDTNPIGGGFGIELVQALLILVIIGGVEQNPGPTFQCRVCNNSTTSAYNYLEHQRLHSQNSNFRFACGYPRCIHTFSSFDSLKNHLFRNHTRNSNFVQDGIGHNISNTPELTFNCIQPCCEQKFNSMKELLCHLRQHIDDGKEIQCPFEMCKKHFRKKTNLNVHVSRYHDLNDTVRVNYQNNDNDSIDYDDENAVGLSENEHEDPDIQFETNNFQCKNEDVMKHIAQFYLKLESKYLLPSSTVQAIADGLKNITSIIHVQMKNALQEELNKCNIPQDKIDCAISAVMNTDTLYNVHNKSSGSTTLHSQFVRKSFYNKHFRYIAPVDVYLGKDDNDKKRYAQYIPIKETLAMLLSDESVQNQIETERKCEEGVLSDFKDGDIFNHHDFFKNKDKLTLQIMLYQDAFEVVNPLGSAKSKHKVLGVYFTLGNLYPENRSKIDNIQLLMLIREKDFTKFKQEKTFRILMEDLKSLEQTGIIYKGENVNAIVSCILGDNLGSHTIGGFVENFSGQYFCRYCDISREELLDVPYLTNDLRTQDEYSNAVNMVNANPLITHEKGVKFDSCFNELDHFHVCNPGLPPCLGHDLFEGVVDGDLALMIKYFIKTKKWFTYQTLNRRIAQYSYQGSDSANKPAPVNISGMRLGGHAVQNWTLLRLFPLIAGSLIKDFKDDVWKLYIQLKVIVELVCAPSISLGQIAYLKVIIEEYLEHRKLLFSDTTMKPKHHFLCHYPGLILKFGPLIRVWTLRCESKHSFFKRAAQACKNFIHITKTLSLKHQLNFAYNSTGQLFTSDIVYNKSFLMNFTQLSDKLRRTLSKANIVSSSLEVHNLQVNGITYNTGMYLILHGNIQQNMVAGKIIFMTISLSNVLHFVLEHKIAEFTSDLGIYKILNTEIEPRYECVLFSEIKETKYYPLPAYVLRGECYLTLKHSSPSHV